MLIYQLLNSVNGKKYVGLTSTSLKRRCVAHQSAARTTTTRRQPIQNAIAKHGWSAFVVTVLEECESLELLQQAERKWIAELGTMVPAGYNADPGGNGGWRHTEESKAKMAEAKRNVEFSEERRRKISEGQRGRVVSEETRRKISAGNTGRKLSQEQRQKISDAQRGRKRKPFTRSKPVPNIEESTCV